MHWRALLWFVVCCSFGLATGSVVAGPAEELIAAADRRDVAAARAALAAKAPIKGPTAGQALTVAATQGDRDMITLLLAAGVPVDEVNANGENALMRASYAGHEGVVAYLLEKGARANFIGPGVYSSSSPLAGALRAGSLPILKMLLQHGADPNTFEGGIVSEANFSGRRDLYDTLKAAGGKDSEHPIMQVEGARAALAALRSKTGRRAPLPLPTGLAGGKDQLVQAAHKAAENLDFPQASRFIDRAWDLGAKDFETRCFRLFCHNRGIETPVFLDLRRIAQVLPKAANSDWLKRDMLNNPFRGEDVPTPEDALNGAMENLRQYAEGWTEVVPSGDDEKVAQWLRAGTETLQAACFVPIVLDSVVMQSAHADRLQQLRTAIQRTFRQSLELQPKGAESAAARSDLLVEFGHYLLVWNDGFDSLSRSFRELLSCHFTTVDDDYSRARLRWELFSSPSSCTARDIPLQKENRALIPTFEWRGPKLTPVQIHQLPEYLVRAPAADDRLFAWNCAIRWLDDDAKAQRTALDMVLALLWEMEPVLSRDYRTYSLWSQFSAPLGSLLVPITRVAAPPSSSPPPFTSEILDFRRNYFCLLATNVERLDLYAGLVRNQKFSAAEHAQVINAIAFFTRRQNGTESATRQLAEMMGIPWSQTPPATSDPSAALAVSRYWEPSQLDQRNSVQPFTGASLCWAEDRLWVLGTHVEANGEVGRLPERSCIYAVDLPKMRTEMIPLPAPEHKHISPGAGLLVTPSHFIVSDVEVGLLLGDRKSKTWEKVPGIVPAGGILVSGNDIYLASARHLRTEHDLNPPPDRIVRYNIQKKTGELISDRTRWPALTPLDDAGLLPELMVWNEERELEIWVRGSTVDVHREGRFAYNLTTKAWRKIPMPDPPFNLARWKPTLKPGFLGYISGRREKLEGAVSPVFSRRSVSATPDPDSTFLLQCKVDETLVASAQYDDNGKYIPFLPANISITDKGWIISESEGRCFWWLPWSDLEAYLAIHPAAAKLIAEYELKSGMTLREKRSP